MNILATQMVMAAAQMEPRLFDLDMQLLSDAVLMIIAVFALFLIASNALFNPVRNMMQSSLGGTRVPIPNTLSALA